MKKSIYIVVALAFLSCQNIDKISKPDVFIGEDRMVEILTDISFLKASKSMYKNIIEEKKINPEAYVYEKHGIDSAVFAQNNNWYTSQPAKYEEVFKRVKDNLEASRIKYEELNKEEEAAKRKQDSIEALKNKKTQILNSMEEKDTTTTTILSGLKNE